MARVHLPALIEKCRRVYDLHRFSWMRDNKVFGWQNMDVRYGGMIARCERAIEYIEEYISGETSAIPELAEERLPLKYHAYITYQRAFTVNYR